MKKQESNPVKNRVKALLKKLNEGLFEKEEVLAHAFLTAVAGESIFLLGAPGVAKSLVARRLKFAFANAKSFEYLMHRFSTPDEIFGPVSISKLKDQDVYERVTEHYLPGASVVFLDEIWKAGPSIQNTLLTVLNEKIFRNGGQEIRIPLKALIAASNELPAQGEGLDALWDRFLMRKVVHNIQQRAHFHSMITTAGNALEVQVDGSLQITADDYARWSIDIDRIHVPENILAVIDVIRAAVAAHNQNEGNAETPIYISDRRWRKIVRLLRTSAFLNSRNSVDLMDCFLIQDCIWDHPDQQVLVQDIVQESIRRHGYSLTMDFITLRDAIEELKAEIGTETLHQKDTRKEIPVKMFQAYYEILGFDDSDNLISIQDYKSLENTNHSVRLSYEQYNSAYRGDYHNLRKGSRSNSLYIKDKEYMLKTETSGDLRILTKKPHAQLARHWDERIAQFFKETQQASDQLKSYQERDLAALKTNLFVKPELATIVESHITATQTEIGKIELEIRKIQTDYKALKDEEKIVK